MKVKDGFKFGIGFMFAYDLYKTLNYCIKWLRKEYKKYVNKTNQTIEKASSHDIFPPCKNRIGFVIE